MFRTSLRSISGPRRPYACRSCLTPSVRHRAPSRQFYNLLLRTFGQGNAPSQPSEDAKNPTEDASAANNNSTPENKPETPQKPPKFDGPAAHVSDSGDGNAAQTSESSGPASPPPTGNGQEPQRTDSKAKETPARSNKAKKMANQAKMAELVKAAQDVLQTPASRSENKPAAETPAQPEDNKRAKRARMAEVVKAAQDTLQTAAPRSENKPAAEMPAQSENNSAADAPPRPVKKRFGKATRWSAEKPAARASRRSAERPARPRRSEEKPAAKASCRSEEKPAAETPAQSENNSAADAPPRPVKNRLGTASRGSAERPARPRRSEEKPEAKASRLSAKKPEVEENLQKLPKSVRCKATGRLKGKDQALTVPRLAYGLERVLHNPGIYQLRDPRSRVFNFDPYLGSIMPVTEFDFESLKQYITSSKDDTLRNIALKEKKKYVGSSSSMTSVLAHFHFLLSAWRPIDTRTLSQGFSERLRSFTRLLRAPTAMFLNYKDGVYAVDADKEFENANILMNLGKSMEKLLTLPKEEFERYRRTSENKVSPEEEQATPESYHYSTLGDFVMRSQLDACDPRLPGTGMFDLKTRAVVSIRMDAMNFERGVGYEIKGRYGLFESYEREFFDMIRAAFLKYSLQVRMGRMDGIFVAFHNIERIFGFQYISLPEMDQALHGQSDTTLGDREFQLSIELWNKILDRATDRYPQQSLRFHFEARDTQTPSMYVFAEPVTDEQMHAIQTKNRDKAEAYHRRILNLEPREKTADESNEAASTQEAAPQTPSEPQTTSDDPSAAPQDSRSPPDHDFISNLEQEDEGEVMGMTITVKNKVNGNEVERPEGLSAGDMWTIDYEIDEMVPSAARTAYDACRRRRDKFMSGRGEDETGEPATAYIRTLRKLSKEGREFRARQDQLDREQGVVVLDEEQPQPQPQRQQGQQSS
ncbi:hypothetical protein PHISP_06360 [Aspergillus sp. HF37]|nr:hypothetical protein PHISP_06360 [Aspergillus sp. HF37]